jgi:tetratricopeptide (TPR) repeat protein
MPLQDLTYLQIAELCRFLEPSATRLWILRHPRDLKPAVMKVLVGIQDDADNTNIFFYFDAPFREAEEYFTTVRKQIDTELAELADTFARVGVALPEPGEESGPAALRLARRADAVASALPECAGSLVLVLDPGPVATAGRFAAALTALAERSQSPRSKYLVLDNGKASEIDRLRKAGPRTGGQDFQLSPEVIERQVQHDLQGNELTPAERRQYVAMSGAFAFARGQLDAAAAAQTEVVEQARQAGEPGEVAVALYNLGNTHLKAKKLAEAEQCFASAAHVCLEAGNDTLLGMVLVNLGIALHRQGKTDQALRSIDAGRNTFRGLNQPVGEVQALDTKAAALAEVGKRRAAERTWREALERVESLPEEDFGELRQSCQADLTAKLRTVS